MYFKPKGDKNNYNDAMYPCLMSINGPYMMVDAMLDVYMRRAVSLFDTPVKPY